MKRLLLLLLIITFSMVVTACKKPEDYEKSGDYQKAYELYMKSINNKSNRLSTPYSNKSNAIKDASDYSELCYKAAECKSKLGDDVAAQALYRKAARKNYTITEKYPVQKKVYVPAGNDDVWVPAGYKEVWIDGKYEEVWVDGDYVEVWVDGHYDENNVYIDGHYEKQQQPGHYERKYIGGHYEQQYVDGHYEKQWVEAHYEIKTHYETRPYSFINNSPYVDMAAGKLHNPAINNNQTNSGNTTVVNNAGNGETSSVELRQAKDRLDSAYRIWIRSGSKTGSNEYKNYMEAMKNYENLKNKNNR